MAGGDADIWVCGQCRSVNNLRAKQCYHCRTPQHLAAVDPAAIEGTGHGQLREIALPEFAASRGEAMVASVLIVIVGVLNVVSTVVSMRVLPTLMEEPDVVPADLGLMTGASLVTLGVAILALVAWAYWLSRVVVAMPALGLGYPAANGLMAFVENFIPGLNLLRVPAIVRDVVRRLEPEQGRGDALIFAAWIGLFGGFLIPRIGFWLNWEESLEGSVRNTLIIQGVAAGLVLIGAIFLVALIWWIEGRVALRRAEQLAGDGERTAAGTSPAPAAMSPAEQRTAALGADARTAALASDARTAALPAEPRLPTPVGTPTPFDPMAAPFAAPRVTAAAPAPTAPAAPFAPTPGAVEPAAPAVPGPLGSVTASPSFDSDAALHRPITTVTGGASTPTPIARPAEEQADVERFADTRPAHPARAQPAPAVEPVPAAEPAPAAQEQPSPFVPADAATDEFDAAAAVPDQLEAPLRAPPGPRLHLLVQGPDSMLATLDGESEAITLAELPETASAIARADGSAVIVTDAAGTGAASLAWEAVRIFTAAGVPTTTGD